MEEIIRTGITRKDQSPYGPTPGSPGPHRQVGIRGTDYRARPVHTSRLHHGNTVVKAPCVRRSTKTSERDSSTGPTPTVASLETAYEVGPDPRRRTQVYGC